MILHVMSDLHFEFMNRRQEEDWWRELDGRILKDAPEAVVLAGDIDGLKNKINMKGVLAMFAKRYPTVLYTPGNHEFFGTSIAEGHRFLTEELDDLTNVQVLLPGTKVVLEEKDTKRKVTFTGGTLWYPDCKEDLAKSYFIDYRLIDDSRTAIEQQHQDFLKQEPGDVVVSHHYPTDESIAPRWAKSSSNIFFCAYINTLLVEWAKAKTLPKLWIHGHTHDPFDYQSNYGFRVFCNPGGYPNEGANPTFWDRIKVEV